MGMAVDSQQRYVGGEWSAEYNGIMHLMYTYTGAQILQLVDGARYLDNVSRITICINPPMSRATKESLSTQ